MIGDIPMHQGRELPRFDLRQIDLPEILGWPVNSTHYIVVKVEVVSKNNRKDIESPQDQQKIEAGLQILNVKALGDEPIDAKALEKQDFENVVARAKSGQL